MGSLNLTKLQGAWPKMSAEQRAKMVEHLQKSPGGLPEDFRLWLRNERPIKELFEINEMITPISDEPLNARGRFFVKNFASDPEAALKYLKEANPDIEQMYWRSGKIVGRRKGDTEDKMLDPDTMSFTELMSDAGDAAYAAYDAAVTTMGSLGPQGLTKKGIKTATKSGGIGAFNEWLRQTIGQKFGLEQDYDYGKITDSAKWSMLPMAGKPLAEISEATYRKAIKPIVEKVDIPKTVGTVGGTVMTGSPRAGLEIGRRLSNLAKPEDPMKKLSGQMSKMRSNAQHSSPGPMSKAIRATHSPYHFLMAEQGAEKPPRVFPDIPASYVGHGSSVPPRFR